MYHIFCIHSPVEGHLDSFQLLAIIKKAAMNILLQVSFSGYMPRKGITESSDITMLNFLRNCQTDLQSGCKSLQSHEQRRTAPLSPHARQQLRSPEFLILAILTGVRWNLRVVLICISLKTKDVEYFLGASLIPLCSRLFPTFSSIRFTVSGFMWKSFIHLDLSFAQ